MFSGSFLSNHLKAPFEMGGGHRIVNVVKQCDKVEGYYWRAIFGLSGM